MGALDGYLAAPSSGFSGVSARTLELVPVLLALAGVDLTLRLADDAFGPRAALFTAVLLAIPPDFCSSGRTRRATISRSCWSSGASRSS